MIPTQKRVEEPGRERWINEDRKAIYLDVGEERASCKRSGPR